MSNDPYGSTVNANNQQGNVFPTTTMETSVGNVQVSDKSYDIQGNVVDSSNDTPIDVNAVHGVQQAPQGGLPSTGLTPQFETNVNRTDNVESTDLNQSNQTNEGSLQSGSFSADNSTKSVQQNPEQTFMPHDTMNDAT